MAYENDHSIQNSTADEVSLQEVAQDGKRRVEKYLSFEMDPSPFWHTNEDSFPITRYITDIVNWKKEFDDKLFGNEKREEMETLFITKMSNDEEVGYQTEKEVNEVRRNIIEENIQDKNIEGEKRKEKKIDTEKETENMLKCWEYFSNMHNECKKYPLTRPSIMDGHTILLKGLSSSAGKLSELPRQTWCPEENKCIQYPSVDFVDSNLDVLMDHANQINVYIDEQVKKQGLTKELVEMSIKFHAWFFISFIRLHGFSDGNGRMSRLLHAYLQLSICPVPVGIYNIYADSSKKDYIKAISIVRRQHETHKCSKNDWCPMSEPSALSAMMLESLWHTWKKVIN